MLKGAKNTLAKFAARAAIAYTQRLGARQKVHYVEDSMRMRARLVASARRHLPVQPSHAPGSGTRIWDEKKWESHSDTGGKTQGR
jgi:hypothetical protein